MGWLLLASPGEEMRGGFRRFVGVLWGWAARNTKSQRELAVDRQDRGDPAAAPRRPFEPFPVAGLVAAPARRLGLSVQAVALTRSATSTNSGAQSNPVSEHEKNESPFLLFCELFLTEYI